ncbi:hypothetical protein D5S17_18550 [Pseudonocardiaceae bacterium YIM PH 21723]|nr:hypothetical protein D5S17_18550 [Pseudonocardiaceae bacterium YIM PH 21723]
MTASASSFPEPLVPELPPGTNAAAIRDALFDDERTAFVEQYQQAMAEATESLDLAPVLELLRAWHRTAIVSQRMGLAAYRQTMATVREIQQTGTSPTAEPADAPGGMYDILRERLGDDWRQTGGVPGNPA